jgi:hypothetical protein
MVDADPRSSAEMLEDVAVQARDRLERIEAHMVVAHRRTTQAGSVALYRQDASGSQILECTYAGKGRGDGPKSLASMALRHAARRGK